MLLNDDLAARAVVHAGDMDWTPSPTKGVDRRMLFRIGDEKARATSIVRYAAGSKFPRHGHPGGEEFLVLEGTFQDESGDFPIGAYVRNPPGTSHAPGSATGCTILVKLWQFEANDQARVVRLPGEGQPLPAQSGVVSSTLFFESEDERVMLEEWTAGARVQIENSRGLEIFVLAGCCASGTDRLDRWSWLRLPAGQSFEANVGAEGAKAWIKSAPLLHGNVCAFESAAH